MISPDDKNSLIETAGLLIHELVVREPMMYIQPYFHNYVVEQVTGLVGKQLDEVFFGAFTCTSASSSICDELDHIIDRSMNLFYKYISPKRSYLTSFIRVKPNIEKMKLKIQYLKDIPQPVQRTPEWYDFRAKCLTASNIWKAFVSESTRNQLIYEKCQPINPDKFNHVSTESPMHWGNKYEPLSILIYERKYKTLISDFGCIPHHSIHFLAASPDGINTLETSDRFGRMIEVKNIVNRDIDGNPKMEYWIQMQVQMEVCNLNECDFLETRFQEYDSLYEFESDSFGECSYSHTNHGKKKGVIIMYYTREQTPHYEYAPLGLSQHAFERWEAENLAAHAHMSWFKNIYWKLDEMSCVLVLRNKLWFTHALPVLEDVWATIVEEKKNNSFTHRAPNKKNKVIKPTIEVNKCYINIQEMMGDDVRNVKVDDVRNAKSDGAVDSAVAGTKIITINTEIAGPVKLDTNTKKITIPTPTLFNYFKKVEKQFID